MEIGQVSVSGQVRTRMLMRCVDTTSEAFTKFYADAKIMTARGAELPNLTLDVQQGKTRDRLVFLYGPERAPMLLPAKESRDEEETLVAACALFKRVTTSALWRRAEESVDGRLFFVCDVAVYFFSE